ncbi:PLP-dependent aminotransferase family protein [Kribbella italica]|uniref:GntR family transcriptional regulator/MocR family aminotransferase n=1 Tax=Kribbella italica TaxID=1540520 RepID=A0A7W9J1L5_9ACTN|nr:PLP-dependent aminotransferase family protein [Kribbella italica]MBB5833961.1 GntR family transcriptional regulator/MocR family aminotransferase [Kribbella italica]
MTVQWKGDGPGLLLQLDRGTPRQLGHQLQEKLRTAIRTGALRPGERLPSSRGLADQLGISRGLVVDTYAQLYAEGYLVSEVGSGTRVAERAEATAPARTTPVDHPSPRFDVDFEYGIPDLASAPVRDWVWALGDAARLAPATLMGDEPDRGDPRLREVLAAYHRRVRAGASVAERTIVTTGFRHALTLVLATLAQHGVDCVGLESPGPRDHDRIAERFGLRSVPVPVDEEGVEVAALSASGARAVVLTPAHQCPTGVALSPGRRQELVAWAEQVDGFVIEDEYDSEFRYDRQPVGSLQGLAPERVIALGSVSKTLAPGIRIGWIFAPPTIVDGLVETKALTSRGAPALDQLALARLMESGRYDRHLRRMRTTYQVRRDALIDAVNEHLPALRLTGLAAGCHAVLRLPSGADEAAVVAAAAQRSVAVRGLGDYRMDDVGAAEPGLVMGFGNVNESAIRRGVRVLADVISDPRQG